MYKKNLNNPIRLMSFKDNKLCGFKREKKKLKFQLPTLNTYKMMCTSAFLPRCSRTRFFLVLFATKWMRLFFGAGGHLKTNQLEKLEPCKCMRLFLGAEDTQQGTRFSFLHNYDAESKMRFFLGAQVRSSRKT